MATTITSTITSTTTLSASSQIPFSIASGGYLNVSTGSGIYSKSTAISPAIINAGRIRSTKSGTAAAGVFLKAGGIVTNLSGGTITGVNYGVYLAGNASGTITNSGIINASTAAGIGVRIKAASATLITAGTIAASTSTGTAVSFSGSGDVLILQPGFAFTGKVTGASGNSSELDLAGTASATLTGLGTNFTKFGVTKVDAGANWTLAGTNSLAAGLVLANYGTLTNTGTLNASVSGTPASINNTGLLINSGKISFNNAVGSTLPLSVSGGGTLINEATGLITGGKGVFEVSMLGDNNTVINRGTITPGTYGNAVYVLGSHNTLTNAGTIGANGVYATAVQITGDDNRLIVAPNAVFNGYALVTGNRGALELSGTSAGTLDLFRFQGFQYLTIDSGATWTAASGFAGHVTNNGTFDIGDNGSLQNSTLVNNALIQGYISSLGNNTILNHGVVFNTGRAIGADTGDVIVNDGTIISYDTGIYAFGDVMVTNQAGGVIIGASGIHDGVAVGTVVNAGSIIGTTSSGYGAIALHVGGSVSNITGGLIQGHSGVLFDGATGSLTNQGTIHSDDGTAVRMADGGSITNVAGGRIEGAIAINASGTAEVTVTNAGTITSLNGVAGSTILFGAGNDRLIIDPGAVFTGIVDGGAGGNVLELAGTVAATISGVGTTFLNFATLDIDAGADWTLTDTLAAGVTLANAGAAAGVALATGNGRVVVETGAAFIGAVQGGGGASVLELTAPGGTLDTIGFSNFGSYVIDAGATWNLPNALAAGVTLVNAGTVGDVRLAAGNGHVVALRGAVFSGSVQGGGTSSVLELGDTGGTIANFDGRFANFGSFVVEAGDAWTLTGTASLASGVVLIDTGALVDATSLNNDGSITGGISVGGGASLGNSGTIANDADGAGAVAGIGVGVLITNSGAIIETSTLGSGVTLDAGGTVINAATGTIEGAVGVVLAAGGTIRNAGSVVGTSGTAVALAGAAARVIVDPGAVFVGTVAGRAGDTIEFAGTSAGSFANGAGFGTTTIDAGATWSLTGSASGTVLNAGTMIETGAFNIGTGGSLANAARVQGYLLMGFNSWLTNQGTIAGTGNAVGGFNGVSIVNSALIAAGGTGSAINLSGVASVTNNTGGTIAGWTGIYGGNTITVVNAGTINATGTTGYGAIGLRGGGAVTNAASAGIQGGRWGIFFQANAGSVSNQGSIGGGTAGIYIGGGGGIANAVGATISGTGYAGITVGGFNTATISNLGSIGGAHFGVDIARDGIVVNGLTGANAGLISGANAGIRAGSGGSATITNTGTIIGTNSASFGIFLANGSGIINNGASDAATGLIQGGTDGIYAQYQAAKVTNFGAIIGITGFRATDSASASNNTVVNAGTIASTAGSAGSAIKFAGGNDLLIIHPGAVFTGSVDGGNGGNTIELAAGASAGTLSGIGTQFTKFGTLRIDANAAWTLGLGAPSAFTGTISGFSSEDVLDLAGITGVTGAHLLANNVLEIDRSAGGPITLQLDSTQDFSGRAFRHAENAGDTLITEGGIACFCPGTLIATERGEVPVERLAVGNRVITLSGGTRPIIWIGHRYIDLTRHRDPSVAIPIRICADAIADGAPGRDLLVSPDHALCIDGGLVPARLLLNGVTIRRETECHQVTYYHIELDAHDALLAEGLPAESYLDTGNRGMFENAGMPLVLHPDCVNQQCRREAESFATLLDHADDVKPIWQDLVRRAEALGYRRPPAPATTADPAVHIRTGRQRIDPVSTVGNRHVFIIPPTTEPLRLLSRSAVPCDAQPWVEDRRRLGVAVRGITVQHGEEVVAVPVDDPRLESGWWDVEQDGKTQWCWTDGSAVLPVFDAVPLVLEIEVASTLAYPVEQDDAGDTETFRCHAA